MTHERKPFPAAAACLAVSAMLAVPAARASESAAADDGVDAIVQAETQPGLRALMLEVLERNPAIAAAAARARAARFVAPQAGSLPDPMLGVTAYVQPPETRVGPQRVTSVLSQRLPWPGKLSLRRQAALAGADAADAQVEAVRLDLVTETRRLYYETAFLDAWAAVVRADRDTLVHYEELARARYASGVGIEQGVVKLQAEITRDDSRLLDIANRRATLVASLNASRDRPQGTGIPHLELPRRGASPPDIDGLRERALLSRPEILQADAEIAQADRLIDVSRREYKPDLTLGVMHTWVGGRTDPAGRLQPPPDDGDDVFGISASINLPIHRGRLEAGVEEAAARRVSAVERKRNVTVGIDRALGELVERVKLAADQIRLFENVLVIQAEQSLRSAEAGYAAGTLDALDLLDAERVLLEVRTGTQRARADHAIAVARLEGAIGAPLVDETASE